MRNTVKFATAAVLFLAMMFGEALSVQASIVTDHYIFSMTVHVPRIYDNTQSLGYRTYQLQRITGEMQIAYDTTSSYQPTILFSNLVNRVHKINGVNITYECFVDDTFVTPRVNLIGNNATGVFRTPSIVFYLNAEPSYALESGEDNALLVTLAGKGNCAKRNGVQVINYLRGSVAGTLGCGCRAYGHVSPTRVAGPYGATSTVDDVASVYGNWTARWKKRTEVR